MPLRPPPAERMTPRARGYLLTAATQWLLIGSMLLCAPSTFKGVAFREVFDIAPRPFWVVALLLGGLHLIYSCVTGNEGHARTALVVSAVVAFMWAAAFGYVIDAGLASVFGLSLLVGCGMRDLIACAQPLRSPFERLAFLLEEHQPPTRR